MARGDIQMTPEETQKMNRDELAAQLEAHPNKRLRLWYFTQTMGSYESHELEFLEVKFEDDEIVVEMGNK